MVVMKLLWLKLVKFYIMYDFMKEPQRFITALLICGPVIAMGVVCPGYGHIPAIILLATRFIYLLKVKK